METWAVKWYASIFFHNGYCLHPRKSLTQNIGNDGTGMNSSKSIQFDHKQIASHINVQPIQIQESKKARNKVRAYYRRNKNTKSLLNQLKLLFSAIFSEKINLTGKTLLDQSLRKKTAELNKVLNTPRFIGSSTNLLTKKVYFNDSASFLFTYKEIFENKVYDFVSSVDRPVIIDAGSNIGLATVRFKELFPNAHIIAIEADKNICVLMKKNFDSFGFKDVEIINAALWSHEGEIYFDSAGADSGRVAKDGILSVKSTLLSNLIDQPVEMVKLDIEGAELNVIKEAKSKLHMVRRMFIEYHSFIKSEQNLDELLSILRESGFRYYISSPGVSNKNPFNKLGKRGYMGMDFQLNIHAERQ
jgi:FkbM family methyltransferase